MTINFKNINIWTSSLFGVDYSKVLNYIFILYAFSTPFMKEFNRPVAILMLLVWILDGKFQEKIKIAFNSKVFWTFSAFIGFYYLSVFWSDEPRKALSYVNGYAAYLAIVVIFTSIKKEFIPHLLTAFIAGMFLSEIITYGIYFELWNTTYNEKNFAKELPTAFMGHGAYSVFLALIIMILINKIIFEKSYLKYIYIFFFILTFGNLMISGGRIGIVVLIVTLFIYVLLSFANKIKALVIAMILFASLFVVAYQNISLFQKRVDMAKYDIEQVIIHNNYNTSWGLRYALNMIGLEVIKESPFYGHGVWDNIKERVRVASLPENKEYVILSQWGKNTNYHNMYMEIATQLGLLGLILFLSIFYFLAKIEIHNIEYFKYKIIFIPIIMLSIISNEGFHHRAPMAIFALLIAIILAQNRIEQEQIKEQ